MNAEEMRKAILTWALQNPKQMEVALAAVESVTRSDVSFRSFCEDGNCLWSSTSQATHDRAFYELMDHTLEVHHHEPIRGRFEIEETDS